MSLHPSGPEDPVASKLSQVTGLWLLALAISALLVAAGRHWPGPLPVRPGLALALVLVPPLLVGAWLGRRWVLPAGPPRGANRQEPESLPTDLESF